MPRFFSHPTQILGLLLIFSFLLETNQVRAHKKPYKPSAKELAEVFDYLPPDHCKSILRGFLDHSGQLPTNLARQLYTTSVFDELRGQFLIATSALTGLSVVYLIFSPKENPEIIVFRQRGYPGRKTESVHIVRDGENLALALSWNNSTSYFIPSVEALLLKRPIDAHVRQHKNGRIIEVKKIYLRLTDSLE